MQTQVQDPIIKNKTQTKTAIFFQSHCVVYCDDEMGDTGSSVNHSSLQSAHQVKRGEEREQEPIRHKPWPIQTVKTVADCQDKHSQ